MLVYDMTNLESFENLKRWNRNLREKSNNDMSTFPRIIVGNKTDLVANRRVTDKDIQKMVKELSEPNEMPVEHMTTSALNGDNITAVFEKVIEQTILSLRRN